MAGRNVMYTMGFDAFGLPAEQYAVQTGQHPAITTEQNITTYRRQLGRLGLSHDKRRSVSTADPSYYRWTQWIFLQIFNAWYDKGQGRARPISELEAEFAAGERRVPGGQRLGDDDAGRSSAPCSTSTAWPTSPRPRSTGARAWAPSSPTRRSPPTAAATAATSRCSSATCASG